MPQVGPPLGQVEQPAQAVDYFLGGAPGPGQSGCAGARLPRSIDVSRATAARRLST
jgi:hypothetical protein